MSFHYTRLEHFEQEHTDTILVNWCLSNVCNYTCSYCPDILHNRTSGWPALEDVEKFCGALMKHYPDRRLYFEFTGGEVTLWNEFPQLCEFIKTRGHFIGFISNGSRRLDWWKSHVEKFDHVCMSFHSESADSEHFLTVVREMAPQVRVHVNIMMNPDRFDECFKVGIEAARVPDVSVALQPLIHDFGTVLYNYTPEQQEILKNQYQHLPPAQFTRKLINFRGAMKKVSPNGQFQVVTAQELVANGENSWMGWDCEIGKEQFVVDMHGNVMRGWCGVGGVLGNFKDPVFDFPSTGVICNKQFCHCNLDIMCTKTK